MASTFPASWVIGVLLCNFSSIGVGVSNLTIRKSWLLEHKAKEEGGVTTSAARMRYAACLFMTTVNPIVKVLALALISPSIVAPFSGVSLAWVVLLSNRIVGEQPEAVRIFGACLIMCGSILVSVFGDRDGHNGLNADEDDQRKLEEMMELRDSYLDPPFLRYLIIAFFLQIGFLLTLKYARHPYLKRFAWGMAGGFATGGFENFIKDAITLLQINGVGGILHFWRMPWYFYLFIVLAIAAAGGGFAVLANCMKRYDATFAAGSMAASYTFMATIMSALHYDTFAHLDRVGFIVYPCGLTFLMVGVGILVYHSQDASPEVTVNNKSKFDAVPGEDSESSEEFAGTDVESEEEVEVDIEMNFLSALDEEGLVKTLT